MSSHSTADLQKRSFISKMVVLMREWEHLWRRGRPRPGGAKQGFLQEAICSSTAPMRGTMKPQVKSRWAGNKVRLVCAGRTAPEREVNYVRKLPDMMSTSEGGGGHGEVDVEREV